MEMNEMRKKWKRNENKNKINKITKNEKLKQK